MIVCDTGPIVSAMNRGEGERHRFAAAVLGRLGREVIVPWPVLTEVDLLLRARGHPRAALAFVTALRDGVHRLETPSDEDLRVALRLGDQYPDVGVDLPDLSVMAIASRHRAHILTWDFRHFRAVVLRKGHHWPLLVEERDVPTAS